MKLAEVQQPDVIPQLMAEPVYGNIVEQVKHEDVQEKETVVEDVIEHQPMIEEEPQEEFILSADDPGICAIGRELSHIHNVDKYLILIFQLYMIIRHKLMTRFLSIQRIGLLILKW